MKKTLALVAAVLALGMTLAVDAEARRLGGGRAAGMQRQQVMPPSRTAPPATNPGSPAQTAPAAGTAAAGTAAAAAPTRSWMGPIAGLAAGLGIAALASHFGFGEALANVMTVALLAMLALAAIGFVMRKRAAPAAGLAGAGAGASGSFARGGSLIGSQVAAPLAATAVASGNIPADFDKAGFERTARDQFMALQAANDARDLERLRDYLTPEMFEVVRAEVAERGEAPQNTEVFNLQAQVLDVADEGSRYVASVRFTGSIREQFGAPIEDLDEVWHLAKPKSGFGGWVIAGIQQVG
jgi:predicted lipid-binding transport protein (Tim44 family)